MSNAAIERMIANRVDAAIAAERTTATTKAAEVARAAVATETTRAAATAEGSNNARPAAGAGGPNVAGPTVGEVAMNAIPKVRGCSYKEFMNSEPTNFKGTERAVGLTHWFERSESLFFISKCVENDKVKYATSTLLDEALSCEEKKLEVELWNHMVKGVDITTYNRRFQELAILCPAMVPTTDNLLERQENAKGYATVAVAPAGGRGYGQLVEKPRHITSRPKTILLSNLLAIREFTKSP
ncbi:hypothetical protein Tco_1241198, partial [Tanacetum coccineum]